MPTYIKWPAPVAGVKLEYAPEILERLRLLSIDAFLALPRVGMSIGGFLTGSVDQGRVRVTDAVEIPCSHANGPGFVLTGPELARASALAFGESRRQVVGWYCSKPRGEMLLDPQQSKLFNEICPEPWHVGLIIRPSTVETTRAALCIRVGQEYVVGQAMELIEYSPAVRQLPVQDVRSEVVSPEEVPMTKREFVTAEFLEAALAEPHFAKAESAGPEPLKPHAPAPEFGSGRPEFAAMQPEFNVPPQVRREDPPIRVPFGDERRSPPQPARWTLRKSILAGAVAAALLVLIYLNRFSIIPRPPLEIKMSEAGGQITIEWNPEALEGIDEGTVVLNDGGQFQTIALDRRLLASGWVRSSRKSGRVTAKLTAGDVTGLGTWSGETIDPIGAAPAPQPPDR